MLRFLLGALAVGGVAAAAPAADYSWSLGTSGNWADPARWSLGGVPGAADNAMIAALGTYTVTVAGTQAAFNVTLDSANATVAASDFTLGGTLTLRAGTWVMGGLGGNPAVFTGGTVTRGVGGTGSFRVDGDVRFRDAAVQGDALAFTTSGSLVRMAGAAAFTPGSVVSFSSTQVHGDLTGVVFEQNAVVNNVTFQTGANVRLGLSAGASLTLGPNAVVRHNDANATGIGVVGRHLFVSNANPFTLTNRGTILDVSGTLYVGKEFTTTNGDPGVTVVNSGLIESRFDTTIHATTFTNSPGGVVRATAGGGVFVFALGGWTNQGTFDVGGAGSTFTMGGRFLRSDIGTITRTGSNTVGFYAARLDNAGGTLALSAATGNYVLYGDQFTSGADVVGGSLSVSGGAKFEVRVYPGAYSGLDYAYLTDVAVGLGALDFEARGGKAFLRGTTAFAAGETVTLAGTDTQLAFAQTKQLDNVTVVLAGRDSSLAVVDNNALTLGPTATVRKTGPDTGFLRTFTIFTPAGAPTLTNFGTVRAEAGTLAAGQAVFVNRGLVEVAAGAAWTGGLATGAGGTVRGAGSVSGGLTFSSATASLRPGTAAAPGRLTVADTGVTLTSGTTLFARVNGSVAGTGHDQLAVLGAVNLGGATLSVTAGGAFTPAASDLVFLVTNDGTDAVSGAFAGLPEGRRSPWGRTWPRSATPPTPRPWPRRAGTTSP